MKFGNAAVLLSVLGLANVKRGESASSSVTQYDIPPYPKDRVIGSGGDARPRVSGDPEPKLVPSYDGESVTSTRKRRNLKKRKTNYKKKSVDMKEVTSRKLARHEDGIEIPTNTGAGVTEVVPFADYSTAPHLYVGQLFAIDASGPDDIVSYFCTASVVQGGFLATAADCLVDEFGDLWADYFVFCPGAVTTTCINGEFDVASIWVDDSWTDGTYDPAFDFAITSLTPEFTTGVDISTVVGDVADLPSLYIPMYEEPILGMGYPENIGNYEAMAQSYDRAFFHALSINIEDQPMIAYGSSMKEGAHGGPMYYHDGLVSVYCLNILGLPDVAWGPRMSTTFTRLYDAATILEG